MLNGVPGQRSAARAPRDGITVRSSWNWGTIFVISASVILYFVGIAVYGTVIKSLAFYGTPLQLLIMCASMLCRCRDDRRAAWKPGCGPMHSRPAGLFPAPVPIRATARMKTRHISLMLHAGPPESAPGHQVCRRPSFWLSCALCPLGALTLDLAARA